jgi:hypothetical protein
MTIHSKGRFPHPKANIWSGISVSFGFLNLSQGEKKCQALFDDLVKNRHSRAGGNAEPAKLLKRADSCFQGMMKKSIFRLFTRPTLFDACLPG